MIMPTKEDLAARIRLLVEERSEDLDLAAYMGTSWQAGKLYHSVPVPGVEAHKNTHADILPVLDDGHCLGARVLELGCHAGAHTLELAKVAQDVVGIDSDDSAVDIGNLVLKYHNVLNARLYPMAVTPASLMDLGLFDVTVFLNTHKWVVKHGGAVAGRAAMHYIKSSVVYFQCPELGEAAGGYLKQFGWHPTLLGTVKGDHVEERYLFRGER